MLEQTQAWEKRIPFHNGWGSVLDQHLHHPVQLTFKQLILVRKVCIERGAPDIGTVDNILDGFYNHGDTCEGCRHIFLYAFGPDFKRDLIVRTKRELIDIPATIAELMQFSLPGSRGRVMTELFETKK